MFPHTGVTYKKSPPGENGFPGRRVTVKVDMGLYDLSTDPGETLDLKEEFPKIVKDLELVADKYRRDLGDDLTKMPCTGCRPVAFFTPTVPVPPHLFQPVPKKNK